MNKTRIIQTAIFSFAFVWQASFAQSSIDYHQFRNTLNERSLEDNREMLAKWIDETPSPDSLQRIFIDTKLSDLRNEPDFWNPISMRIQNQYYAAIPEVENKLRSFMIWQWGAEDLKFRSLHKYYDVDVPDFGTPEFKVYQKTYRKENERRAEMVLALMKEYDTWLTTDFVGKYAEYAGFFIIQHAEHRARKKALPYLKEAVDKGATSPKFYALMYDRYLLLRGKPQVYGTQLIRTDGNYRLDKNVGIATINENRKELGLSTVQEYVLESFGEKVYEIVFGE
jgi:hypothetical protein